MAKYTIELRHIVENGHNIFPFLYPFYDEKARPDFERDFIRHFYFREIGVDTIDRFILNLEDKMHTVFPYYNELLRTAQIEYSVLDNYNITERTTMKRDNVGESRGVSSSVGQVFDDQSGETNENRSQNTSDTRNGTSTTTNNETVNKENEASQTVNGEKTKNSTVTENGEQEDIKKFLDTPQGAVNLSDSKYLTTLNHDTATRENETVTDETLTDDQTTTGNGTENITTNGTRSTTDEITGTGTETGNTKTDTTFKGEQRSTNDNNTRMKTEGSTVETIEHTRKGNIGVDTDADMIQKHIKLQQTLKKIEAMFFDECEDLFMLVY